MSSLRDPADCSKKVQEAANSAVVLANDASHALVPNHTRRDLTLYAQQASNYLSVYTQKSQQRIDLVTHHAKQVRLLSLSAVLTPVPRHARPSNPLRTRTRSVAPIHARLAIIQPHYILPPARGFERYDRKPPAQCLFLGTKGPIHPPSARMGRLFRRA